MAEDFPQALAFGEILFDIIGDHAYLGGAPLNFAWYLRQFGVRTGIISAIGDDQYGRQANALLRDAGIDLRYVTVTAQPTGTVEVKLTNGQPEYVINQGVAWDQIPCIDLPTVPALLYFGTLAQRTPENRTSLSALLSKKPVHRFFDINLRQHFYSDDLILDGLKYATIVKLNDDEWVQVRSIVDVKVPKALLSKFGLQALIITHGGDGASIYEGADEYHGCGSAVEVIDAVGAGDSFSAAIAAGVLFDVPLSRVLPTACEVGAFVVSQRGAQAILPEPLRQAFK